MAGAQGTLWVGVTPSKRLLGNEVLRSLTWRHVPGLGREGEMWGWEAGGHTRGCEGEEQEPGQLRVSQPRGFAPS